MVKPRLTRCRPSPPSRGSRCSPAWNQRCAPDRRRRPAPIPVPPPAPRTIAGYNPVLSARDAHRRFKGVRRWNRAADDLLLVRRPSSSRSTILRANSKYFITSSKPREQGVARSKQPRAVRVSFGFAGPTVRKSRITQFRSHRPCRGAARLCSRQEA